MVVFAWLILTILNLQVLWPVPFSSLVISPLLLLTVVPIPQLIIIPVGILWVLIVKVLLSYFLHGF